MVTVTNFEYIGPKSATPTSTPNKANATSKSSFAQTLQETSSQPKATEKTDASAKTDAPIKPEHVEASEESVDTDAKAPVLSLEYLLASTKVDEKTSTEGAIDISALFQATTAEELTKLLGGKALVEGEQLTLSNVASALGMTETDLQSLIAKLTGSEQQANDVWDALSKVDQNLFPILQQLAASINGHAEATLSRKEAQQAVSFLKLIDLAAPKTDLLLNQQLQTAQTKNWLANLSSQITTKTVEKEVAFPFAKMAMRFQTAVTENTQTNQVNAQQVPTSKVQTFTIQLPANATPQSQSAKFVEEFQSVLNRAQFASNAAGTRLLIKLYPENLGTIRIELVQKDGILSAKLLASNAMGKQMLDSTLNQLKQGFANQSIQVDRIDVAQAISEPNKGERQFNQQQPNNQQRTTEEEQQQHKEDELKSFEDILAEMEE